MTEGRYWLRQRSIGTGWEKNIKESNSIQELKEIAQSNSEFYYCAIIDTEAEGKPVIWESERGDVKQ